MQHKRKFTSVAVSDALIRLGSRIRAARRSKHLTLVALEDATRIDRTTLGRLERGDSGVSLGLFLTVLEALGEIADVELILTLSTADQVPGRAAMGSRGAKPVKPILDRNF